MNRACSKHPQAWRLGLSLTVLIGLLLAHRDALAQQREPQPCPDATRARPELQLTPEARPSLIGPLLLTFAGPFVAVGSLALGVEHRPLCTDGCTRSIPAPFLVAAAVGGGATLLGTVWLIARWLARSEYDRQRRYGFELQLTPTIASAQLSLSF